MPGSAPLETWSGRTMMTHHTLASRARSRAGQDGTMATQTGVHAMECWRTHAASSPIEDKQWFCVLRWLEHSMACTPPLRHGEHSAAEKGTSCYDEHTVSTSRGHVTRLSDRGWLTGNFLVVAAGGPSCQFHLENYTVLCHTRTSPAVALSQATGARAVFSGSSRRASKSFPQARGKSDEGLP
jgi:hypothetical protein